MENLFAVVDGDCFCAVVEKTVRIFLEIFRVRVRRGGEAWRWAVVEVCSSKNRARGAGALDSAVLVGLVLEKPGFLTLLYNGRAMEMALMAPRCMSVN